mgnify:CR=1 FL=1
MSIRMQAGRLCILVSEDGWIRSLLDSLTGRECAAEGQPSPLASLYGEGRRWLPTGVWQEHDRLSLSLDGGMRLDIDVRPEEAYTVLTVVDADFAGHDVEVLFWGPFATSVAQQVGEVIGVVCDTSFGIGLQTLNVKTQGGWPYCLIDSFSTDSLLADGFQQGMPGSIPLHLQAASARTWGSTLQAFTFDGTKPCVRTVGQFPDNEIPVAQVPALSGPDALVTGSSIALFGCGTPDGTPGTIHGDLREAVLSVLSRIECREGLPHPMLDGEWQKTSLRTTAPYFILTDLSRANVDACCAHARRAGIGYIYRDGMFASDGHYQFQQDFDACDDGMRDLVEKASRHGIRVGIHTMTGFIQGADPYVTPVPDPRLLSAGSAPLRLDCGEKDLTLVTENPELFQKGRGTEIRIGDELITFTQALPQPDGSVRLTGCLRGSFGTTTAPHKAGEPVLRMWPDAYGGLHVGLDLIDEVSGRLAEIFNHTGVRQISFDGAEDLYLTGYDAYAHSRFMDHFWFSLEHPENVINDGSRLTHHNWHMASRMNWGEPWGETMRQGQMAYRYRNQDFFNRNFFPRMLGWFLFTMDSPLVDIEWALAKSAGFDAGYALVTSLAILEGNPQSVDILEAVRQWEAARRAGAFPVDLRKRLLLPELDWHLEEQAPHAGEMRQTEQAPQRWTLRCLTPGQETVYELTAGDGLPWEPLSLTIEESRPQRTEKMFLRDCIAKTQLVFGDRECWPATCWDALQARLQEAIVISGDAESTQAAIDVAVAALVAARGQMVRVDGGEPADM